MGSGEGMSTDDPEVLDNRLVDKRVEGAPDNVIGLCELVPATDNKSPDEMTPAHRRTLGTVLRLSNMISGGVTFIQCPVSGCSEVCQAFVSDEGITYGDDQKGTASFPSCIKK